MALSRVSITLQADLVNCWKRSGSFQPGSSDYIVHIFQAKSKGDVDSTEWYDKGIRQQKEQEKRNDITRDDNENAYDTKNKQQREDGGEVWVSSEFKAIYGTETRL